MVNRSKIIAEQIEFAADDTLCFFAPYPDSLVALQREKWQPLIDAMNQNGCDFRSTQELAAPALSEKTKDYLSQRLNALDDEALCAFGVVSGGCKSVILALNVLDGKLNAADAFDLAVLEETWQNGVWTRDEEAVTARENRKQAVLQAAEKLKGNKNG